MSDPQELFFRLYLANGETEVQRIVSGDPLLSNGANWQPYGDNKGNFGTFENQQPNPIPALVEKLTNSIDSLLLRECRVRGIDPKSDRAPRSMEEALDFFFGIKNWIIEDESKRYQLADRIQLIATGDKKTPDLVVYDDGEGQHPDDFKNTFLSLQNNNKVDIHFVQGKYNMGSTGAVVFCGDQRYQLIGSKRFPDLFNGVDNKENEFGFTLVRRHSFGSKEEEARHTNSWYEYFAPGGRIARFPIIELDLNLVGRNFISGSVIKLFSYQLPHGSQSLINFALWQDLNQYLYKPALPMILSEQRNQNTRKRQILLGNYTRIETDKKDNVEKTIFISKNNEDFGKIEITITVFKDKNAAKTFVKGMPVLFTLNGQTNGTLPGAFISNDLGFKFLAKCSIIHIDCTEMYNSYRQDIFMGNRSTLKQGQKYTHLIGLLVEELRHNEDLRSQNQAKMERLMSQNEASESGLENVLDSLPKDAELIRLLQDNGTLKGMKQNAGTRNSERTSLGRNKGHDRKPRKTQRFPALFQLDNNQKNAGRAKALPVNGKASLRFQTDVTDDYFFRPHDRGDLRLDILSFNGNKAKQGSGERLPGSVEEILNVKTEGPSDGIVKVTLEPHGDLVVGDEIELSAKLAAPGGDLEAVFQVRITNPQSAPKTKAKPENDQPALPRLIQVFQESADGSTKTWEDYEWNGEDVVQIIEEDNKIAGIAVNMDSFVLKRFISGKRLKSEGQIEFAKKRYIFQIFLHSLYMYNLLKAEKKVADDSGARYESDPAESLSRMFKKYSEFLLHLGANKELMSAMEDS